MPEHIAITCNLIAGVLVLFAFLLYNRKGGAINTGTWVILAFGDSLDLASYFEMTEEWWKSILPAAFALGSLFTLGYGCLRKRFSWPDRIDWCIVFADLAIIWLWSWYDTHSGVITIGSRDIAAPAAANLAFQATAVIAFIPMYRGLIAGREREHAGPWLVWSLAFAVFFVSSIFTLATIEEIAYPVVGLVTHAIVLSLALSTARPLRR